MWLDLHKRPLTWERASWGCRLERARQMIEQRVFTELADGAPVEVP